MDEGDRLRLPDAVDAGQGLGVVGVVEVQAVKHRRAGRVQGDAEACRLDLGYKDLDAGVLLERLDDGAPLVHGDLAVDAAIADAALFQQLADGGDLGAEAGKDHQLLPGLLDVVLQDVGQSVQLGAAGGPGAVAAVGLYKAAGQLHQPQQLGQDDGGGDVFAVFQLDAAGPGDLRVQPPRRALQLHIPADKGLPGQVQALGLGHPQGDGVLFACQLVHVLVAYDLVAAVAAHLAVA